jgi:hypothetical protein
MWTFAFDATLLNSFQSLVPVCQLLIPTLFRSSSTSSIHLVRGLPLYRIPSTDSYGRKFMSLADFNIWCTWNLQNKLKIKDIMCMKKL